MTPPPTGSGKKKQRGPSAASKIPTGWWYFLCPLVCRSKVQIVTPHTKCRLRLLKLERIKDFLLMEEEFVQNQERLKPQEEKTQVIKNTFSSFGLFWRSRKEERSKVDELRGSPITVGTLEERIDENHAIVGSSVGPEYYVTIMSFVDKDQLEPGCSILLHNKARFLFSFGWFCLFYFLVLIVCALYFQ